MVTINDKLNNILIEVLEEYIEIEKSEVFDFDKSLKEFGLNSISYIKLIIQIEAEFKFEFDDDKLNFKSFDSIKDLTNYIEYKLKSK